MFKIHIECGAELFGEQNKGKMAEIVRVLYGLKSAGASMRNHLSTLKWCKADQETYYKMMIGPDGRTYYANLVVYIDDILTLKSN